MESLNKIAGLTGLIVKYLPADGPKDNSVNPDKQPGKCYNLNTEWQQVVEPSEGKKPPSFVAETNLKLFNMFKCCDYYVRIENVGGEFHLVLRWRGAKATKKPVIIAKYNSKTIAYNNKGVIIIDVGEKDIKIVDDGYWQKVKLIKSKGKKRNAIIISSDGVSATNGKNLSKITDSLSTYFELGESAFDPKQCAGNLPILCTPINLETYTGNAVVINGEATVKTEEEKMAELIQNLVNNANNMNVDINSNTETYVLIDCLLGKNKIIADKAIQLLSNGKDFKKVVDKIKTYDKNIAIAIFRKLFAKTKHTSNKMKLAKVLVEYGDSKAANYLCDYLIQGKFNFLLTSESISKLLINNIEKKNVKKSLARLVIKSTDKKLAKDILEKLIKLGAKAAPELLDIALNTTNMFWRDKAVKALVELGDKAIPQLRSLISKTTYHTTKMEIAHILLKAGDTPTMVALYKVNPDKFFKKVSEIISPQYAAELKGLMDEIKGSKSPFFDNEELVLAMGFGKDIAEIKYIASNFVKKTDAEKTDSLDAMGFSLYELENYKDFVPVLKSIEANIK